MCWKEGRNERVGGIVLAVSGSKDSRTYEMTFSCGSRGKVESKV